MDMNKFAVGLAQLIQLGCITGLTYIGLKRNNDCYKAECELSKKRFELILAEHEIWKWENGLNKVKSEKEESE